MSATVRLFSYDGMSTAFIANYNQQQSMTGTPMFKQPYKARASLTVDENTAQATTTDLTPENTRLVYVQVDPGKRVHYEVNPPNFETRVADTESPILEGNDVIEAGRGWTFSFLEVAS
jgi:hypothetical protein